jgi:hypothetical protein
MVLALFRPLEIAVKHTAVIAAALALGATLPSAPAQAQNMRSFVSGLGSDSNPCTRIAPCRTFQVAHNNTSAGGEIDVLDSAGYGSLVISKPISIVNDGVGAAGVLAPSGGTGIKVQAGPNDKINLRGLTIEGAGVGFRGIEFDSGGTLSIVDCFVRNFGGDGIILQPNSNSTVWISNTISSDNGITGINIVVLSTVAFGAYLDRTTTNNNTYGVHANNIAPNGANMVVSVSNSVSNNNSSYAYFAAAGLLNLQNVFYSATTNSAAGSNTVHVANSASGPALLVMSRSTGGDVVCDSNANVITYGNNEVPGFFFCTLLPSSLR